MSKVIAENHNGKVLKVSNGFNTLNAIKFIKKFASENNIDFSIEKAKTGTSYIQLDGDNEEMAIRVSNHTKRDWDMDSVDYNNKKMYNHLVNKEVKPYNTFQCVDVKTFEMLKELLLKL